MTINATLLIQMINFLIAYGVLRFFLFRPVVTLLENEQAEHEQVQETLSVTHQAVTRVKEEQRRELAVCQRYFTQNAPVIVHESVSPADAVVSSHEHNQGHAKNHAQELVQDQEQKMNSAIILINDVSRTLRDRVIHHQEQHQKKPLEINAGTNSCKVNL